MDPVKGDIFASSPWLFCTLGLVKLFFLPFRAGRHFYAPLYLRIYRSRVGRSARFRWLCPKCSLIEERTSSFPSSCRFGRCAIGSASQHYVCVLLGCFWTCPPAGLDCSGRIWRERDQSLCLVVVGNFKWARCNYFRNIWNSNSNRTWGKFKGCFV